MEFDEAAVARLAELARLDLPAGRAGALASELSRVVAYVASLDDLVGAEGADRHDEPVPACPRRADAATPGLSAVGPGAMPAGSVRLPTVVESG